MKKICFVTTTTYALSVFVLDLAKQMADSGEWDVTFVSVPDEDFEKSLPGEIRYIAVPMGRGVSADALSACRKLYQIFKRERFDIVQYSTPNASCYASIAAALAKVPVRLYGQWGMVYVGFSGIKRRLFKAIEKLVCRCSTVIEPDSFGNLCFAQEERLYPNGKGRVIGHGSACGVSFEKFDVNEKPAWRAEKRAACSIAEDDFVFGFVGRITKDKGVNELFAAMRRLAEKEPKAKLLMVGGYDKVDTIQPELWAWATQTDHVIFVGYTQEVPKYLAAMDVLVLPSYREGFGQGVIEAQAMAVPVIVTDIPGPRESTKNEVTGLIVAVKNDEALHGAMLRMMREPEHTAAMACNGRVFALENFEQRRLFETIIADRRSLVREEDEDDG